MRRFAIRKACAAETAKRMLDNLWANKYEGTTTTKITIFSYTEGYEKRSGVSLMIKTTMRYCYIPTRMTKTNKTDNSKC